MVQYSAGDVVWAFMESFPWWPGVLMNREELKLDEGELEPNITRGAWVVLFFNSDDEFVVRKPRHLRPFNIKYRDVNGKYDGAFSRALRVAVDMASQYVLSRNRVTVLANPAKLATTFHLRGRNASVDTAVPDVAASSLTAIVPSNGQAPKSNAQQQVPPKRNVSGPPRQVTNGAAAASDSQSEDTVQNAPRALDKHSHQVSSAVQVISTHNRPVKVPGKVEVISRSQPDEREISNNLAAKASPPKRTYFSSWADAARSAPAVKPNGLVTQPNGSRTGEAKSTPTSLKRRKPAPPFRSGNRSALTTALVPATSRAADLLRFMIGAGRTHSAKSPHVLYPATSRAAEVLRVVAAPGKNIKSEEDVKGDEEGGALTTKGCDPKKASAYAQMDEESLKRRAGDRGDDGNENVRSDDGSGDVKRQVESERAAKRRKRVEGSETCVRTGATTTRLFAKSKEECKEEDREEENSGKRVLRSGRVLSSDDGSSEMEKKKKMYAELPSELLASLLCLRDRELVAREREIREYERELGRRHVGKK